MAKQYSAFKTAYNQTVCRRQPDPTLTLTPNPQQPCVTGALCAESRARVLRSAV
jgi:hypothetical protein